MSGNLWIGALMLAVAAVLFFIGLPDAEGVSPRFLRFSAAPVLYPPVILTFLAGGVAELVTAFLGASLSAAGGH